MHILDIPTHAEFLYTDEICKTLNCIPTVHAVPLDKLCEWLAGYAEPPLDALTMCDNPFEAWKMTLTEWMEEQDESN